MEEKTQNSKQSFLQTVDSIYGLYLDCVTGLVELRNKLINLQNQSLRMGVQTSIEKLDTCNITFGKGAPWEGKSLHICTQGELKERTKRGGQDSVLMAQLFLVMIYSYWEKRFRSEIAKEQGRSVNEIKSDIMGDLKWIRHSIIHNKGVALPEIKKTRVIKWFKVGEFIHIDEKKFDLIVDTIKKEFK